VGFAAAGQSGRAQDVVLPSECWFSAVSVSCKKNVHCEMLSTMAPISLSHGDCAPGAGAEDCITNVCRFCRVELGSRPRRRQT
jgi:hypothetical protein